MSILCISTFSLSSCILLNDRRVAKGMVGVNCVSVCQLSRMGLSQKRRKPSLLSCSCKKSRNNSGIAEPNWMFEYLILNTLRQDAISISELALFGVRQKLYSTVTQDKQPNHTNTVTCKDCAKVEMFKMYPKFTSFSWPPCGTPSRLNGWFV